VYFLERPILLLLLVLIGEKTIFYSTCRLISLKIKSHFTRGVQAAVLIVFIACEQAHLWVTSMNGEEQGDLAV